MGLTISLRSPAPSAAEAPQHAASPAAASRLAGFVVRNPAYLPGAYTQAGDWAVRVDDSGIYVVSSYRHADHDAFLVLNQTEYAVGASFEQLYGGNEELSDVTVAGQQGMWISGRLMTDPDAPPVDQGAEPRLQPTNWLVWQEGPITYTLFGNSLTQAEMVRVAESLVR